MLKKNICPYLNRLCPLWKKSFKHILILKIIANKNICPMLIPLNHSFFSKRWYVVKHNVPKVCIHILKTYASIQNGYFTTVIQDSTFCDFWCVAIMMNSPVQHVSSAWRHQKWVFIICPLPSFHMLSSYLIGASCCLQVNTPSRHLVCVCIIAPLSIQFLVRTTSMPVLLIKAQLLKI